MRVEYEQIPFFTFDASEGYSIPVSADGPSVNLTWTGLTDAPATPAPESTATATETTSTEALGFGTVIALLALSAAGMGAVRQD